MLNSLHQVALGFALMAWGCSAAGYPTTPVALRPSFSADKHSGKQAQFSRARSPSLKTLGGQGVDGAPPVCR